MELLIYVMNKTEKLDQLLHVFSENNLTGATIINSTGMMHKLYDDDVDSYKFLSLRNFFDPERKESKTIMMVVSEEQVELVTKIIEGVVGDLNQCDNGIVFTVPVNFSKGLNKWK